MKGPRGQCALLLSLALSSAAQAKVTVHEWVGIDVDTSKLVKQEVLGAEERAAFVTNRFCAKPTSGLLKTRWRRGIGMTPPDFEEAIVEASGDGGIHGIYLDRRDDEKKPTTLTSRIRRYFLQSLEKEVPLPVGMISYVGTIDPTTKKSVFKRDHGHFVLVTRIDRGSRSGAEDMSFAFEYWDPLDGKVHSATAYEQAYQSFTAERLGQKIETQATGLDGSSVTNPYLEVNAPEMGHPDVAYDIQRTVIAMEYAVGAFDP